MHLAVSNIDTLLRFPRTRHVMLQTLTRNQEKHCHDGFAVMRVRYIYIYIYIFPILIDEKSTTNGHHAFRSCLVPASYNSSRLQYGLYHIFRAILLPSSVVNGSITNRQGVGYHLPNGASAHDIIPSAGCLGDKLILMSCIGRLSDNKKTTPYNVLRSQVA